MFRSCTIRYLADPVREVTVPVGVALSDEESGALLFRFPRAGERIAEVDAGTMRAFLELVKGKLEAWREPGRLPYQTEAIAPLSERWWEHVRGLMRFMVRFDPPHPIDCLDPAREIHSLFEALVQPRIPPQQRAQRIDTAIRRALGESIAGRFEAKARVPGYRGRLVTVKRYARGADEDVVLDGVNLALKTAEDDADALTSRLLRVRHNPEQRPVRFVLGYLGSPSGLNGEAVLKEWLEDRLGCRLYDLERESERFRDQAAGAIEDRDAPVLPLFPDVAPAGR